MAAYWTADNEQRYESDYMDEYKSYYISLDYNGGSIYTESVSSARGVRLVKDITAENAEN